MFLEGSFLSRLLRGCTVVLWGQAHLLFENLGEILHVQDTAMQSHRLDLELGGGQEVGGVGDALFPNVFRYRLSGLLLKNGGKIAVAQALALGQGVQG